MHLPMPFPRILVVEEHEPFRRCILLELQKRAEFKVVGEVSDGLEAVQLAQKLKPHIILLDISLPNLNGMEAARRIRRVVPQPRVLFVSLESSWEIVQAALRLGALGYVQKQRILNDLLPAIDTVLQGKQFVSEGLEPSSAQAPCRHELFFCADDTILLDGLARFIAAALMAGDPAIVWATESHRYSLRERVRASGVDIDAAIQRGTYLPLDVSETPDLAQIRETLRGLSDAASKAGKEHPRIAVCGERAGRLWAEGQTDVAIRLEQICNELAREFDMDVLCAYPLRQGHVDDVALNMIFAEHSAISR
jgi:DNA-binding NarL/FixJ family response regulator